MPWRLMYGYIIEFMCDLTAVNGEKTHQMTLWYFVFLYLIFLSQQVLYFLLSTLVLTLYIDVVLSLSIVLKIIVLFIIKY